MIMHVGLRRALRRYRRRQGLAGDNLPAPRWLFDALLVAAWCGFVWAALDLAIEGRGPALGEMEAIGLIAGGAGWGSWLRGRPERRPGLHPGRW